MVSRAHGLRPAVFLDRDGVIVVPEFRDRRSFAPRRLGDFRLYPEAAASLKKLKQAGFLLAVVTNQPDVGNGLVDRSEVDAMHEIITHELPVDTIKACFHRQVDDCNCRKPKPGMILEAASELGVDLTKSFMVGARATLRRAVRPGALPFSSISAMPCPRRILPITSRVRSPKPPTSSSRPF